MSNVRERPQYMVKTTTLLPRLPMKGPGSFHRREKTLARIPTGVLKLLLPGAIHETKTTHSDLS